MFQPLASACMLHVEIFHYGCKRIFNETLVFPSICRNTKEPLLPMTQVLLSFSEGRPWVVDGCFGDVTGKLRFHEDQMVFPWRLRLRFMSSGAWTIYYNVWEKDLLPVAASQSATAASAAASPLASAQNIRWIKLQSVFAVIKKILKTLWISPVRITGKSYRPTAFKKDLAEIGIIGDANDWK